MLSTEMGYAYAKTVSDTLNRAMRNHPISDSENYKGYAVLLRTIQTSLDMALEENNKHLIRCPACGRTSAAKEPS